MSVSTCLKVSLGLKFKLMMGQKFGFEQLKSYRKWLKPLASVKLAVITLSSLALLIAYGTLVEAEFNAEIAAKTIYKTPLMFAVMGLLALNLLAVMVDRLPWKRRHLPFLLAHIGILMLLGGSVLTMQNGLDGTMSFGIGQKNRFVQTNETELTIWASFDGEKYTQFKAQSVDFYSQPPGDKHKYIFPLSEGPLEVLEYWPFAVSSRKIEATPGEASAGSALRFQIQSVRANTTEWMVQSKPGELASHSMGPATFHLGAPPAESLGINQLYLNPVAADHLDYTIFYADPAKKPLRGVIEEGGVIKTGWMDFELRVLRYLPKAKERWVFEKLERPTPLTTSAIRVSYQGKEHWVQLNDILKLFTANAVYILSYGNRRIDIGFEMSLAKFEMGTYPGTQRASSYQSLVEVQGDQTPHLISMNEPLKRNGLTFYQASFNSGPDGKPSASILSVNYDPGRPLKYLGSLILSLGIVWLFYDKRRSAAAGAIRARQVAQNEI